MNWKRRFSSASVHELLSPGPAAVRIRTYSDSVAQVATPEAEEMPERDSELAVDEAGRRRRSPSNSSAGSSENHAAAAVTGFLASQTLALFLAVPTQHQTVRYEDLSPSGTVSGDDENNESANNNNNNNRLARSISLRRSSDLNSIKPWRRLSEKFSGVGHLSVSMASATKLRRNTVVAVSTGKLDQVSAEGRLSVRSDDSMTIEPLSSSSSNKENNNNNNKTLSNAEVGPPTQPRNPHQLKKFSQSTPALPQLHYDLQNLGGSKSRQKKFLRHFPFVPRDERVLNHYSCALVGDILLQGHLYVTYNYFAFHSNVFGYVRKILIPMSDVRKITKEKTAKFFPNAIAICTLSEKHLFSSLMSREVAYKLAVSVWNKFHFPNRMEDCLDGERENEGSSVNGELSSNESSRNSVDGLLIHNTASSSVQVTSATETTSSDPDENDSAIERSYSPTPDRDESKTNSVQSSGFAFSLGQLSAASSTLAKSRNSLLSMFSSRTIAVGDADQADGHIHSTDASDDESTDKSQRQSNQQFESNWGYRAVCLLVFVLCLSAAVLWYRVFLLHSNLELKLMPTEHVKSLYSPQMQELVDHLHLLLTSRSADEQRKGLP